MEIFSAHSLLTAREKEKKKKEKIQRRMFILRECDKRAPYPGDNRNTELCRTAH